MLKIKTLPNSKRFLFLYFASSLFTASENICQSWGVSSSSSLLHRRLVQAINPFVQRKIPVLGSKWLLCNLLNTTSVLRKIRVHVSSSPSCAFVKFKWPSPFKSLEAAESTILRISLHSHIPATLTFYYPLWWFGS